MPGQATTKARSMHGLAARTARWSIIQGAGDEDGTAHGAGSVTARGARGARAGWLSWAGSSGRGAWRGATRPADGRRSGEICRRQARHMARAGAYGTGAAGRQARQGARVQCARQAAGAARARPPPLQICGRRDPTGRIVGACVRRTSATQRSPLCASAACTKPRRASGQGRRRAPRSAAGPGMQVPLLARLCRLA